MFGSKTKRQLEALQQEHAALIADNVEKDEAIAALKSQLTKARADRDVSEGLHQEERKARRIAEVRHAAALQTVTSERDALRPDAERYRAGLARLAAANAARKAAAESKRAH